MFTGDGVCGKTHFMAYIQENLGEENYSFLPVKVSKQMTGEMFEQLLYKKAKIGVNADKNKYLSAINGKKLVILLDDINTIDE